MGGLGRPEEADRRPVGSDAPHARNPQGAVELARVELGPRGEQDPLTVLLQHASGNPITSKRMFMPIGYAIAIFLVSAGTALLVIGLSKIRSENDQRIEQGWAQRRAYYEIPPYLRLS